MSGITLFQCIPSYKPIPTVRLIKSLIACKCKILIDIEDSIQDVQNPELTPKLKAKARKDFAAIIQSLPEHKLSLRINSVRSNEFVHDIELLHKFAPNLESIFIPKVEHSNDLNLLDKAFNNNYKLNLIIETQKGIENIDEILTSKFKDRIDFVFFGNYDFHLDQFIYPITEQYTLNYWKMVEPIILKVESHKIKFGNSPYSNIADTDCLEYSIIQLKKLCKQSFSLMSLHKTQTTYFQKRISELCLNNLNTMKINHKDFTLETFTNKKQKGRSFALVNKRIITPQEYLLLLKKQNG